MPQKRRIEVFTAGCPVCEDAVEQIKSALGDRCDVTVYDLNKGCETNECREMARAYGVKCIPAVAVDGKLVDCCSTQGIDIDVVKQQCGCVS